MCASCICITRNRRAWLPRAIECFLRQTHEQRELLILIDGDDVTDIIPKDPRIRTLLLASRLPIGAKRNLACLHSRGEVIVHWDDDDYSAPGRIASQVRKLEQSGKAVTAYQSMKFTDGKNWFLYSGNAAIAVGTSLCYRRDWWLNNRFPEQQISEDSEFARAAANGLELVTEGDQGLMFATIHPDNTSDRGNNLNAPPWSELPGFVWADPS
jgi:glycosyltransferase involved in cell wall biosynthesis